MGEYWTLVNATKCEEVDPHTCGNGLKWREWATYFSHTVTCLRELLRQGRWRVTDEIGAVSDYGGQSRLANAEAIMRSNALPEWVAGEVDANYNHQWPNVAIPKTKLNEIQEQLFESPVDVLDRFILEKRIAEGDRNLDALEVVLDGGDDPLPPEDIPY